jgi:hypothetical protein
MIVGFATRNCHRLDLGIDMLPWYQRCTQYREVFFHVTDGHYAGAWCGREIAAPVCRHVHQ